MTGACAEQLPEGASDDKATLRLLQRVNTCVRRQAEAALLMPHQVRDRCRRGTRCARSSRQPARRCSRLRRAAAARWSEPSRRRTTRCWAPCAAWRAWLWDRTGAWLERCCPWFAIHITQRSASLQGRCKCLGLNRHCCVPQLHLSNSQTAGVTWAGRNSSMVSLGNGQRGGTAWAARSAYSDRCTPCPCRQSYVTWQ